MSDTVSSIPLCPRCNSFTMSESHTYPPVSINDFRSNVVPSTEDHAQISKIIENEELELERYGQEITRLRGIVNQLERDRSTLQTRITQRRSFISSRRRLPSELWFEIFDLACGSKEYSLIIHYDSNVGVALPSLLSQVSTQWRGILESLPHLWSSISIDITRLKLGIDALLEQYFRNAADFPLTVRVVYNGNPDDCNNMQPNSIAVLQLIFRNIARCKALDIVNYHNAKVMALVPVPPATVSFPLLQSIKIYSSSSEENPQFWDNVRAAPRLTHATITGVSSLRLLPLGKLVSLHIQRATSSEPILDILRECNSLQTLKMTDLARAALNIGPAGQTLTMPFLQCLSIEFWECTSEIEALLSALVLPSLRSLELSQESGHQDVVRLVPLLQPFSQSLAKISFDLRSLSFSRGSIVQVFRALPCLTDSKIWYYGESEAHPYLDAVGSMHELLLVLGADSSVAPQLRSLWLYECCSPFGVKLVEAAIATLEEQVRPLKCIELHFKGDEQQLPAELLARMRNLKERGIECIVRFEDLYY